MTIKEKIDKTKKQSNNVTFREYLPRDTIYRDARCFKAQEYPPRGNYRKQENDPDIKGKEKKFIPNKTLEQDNK